MRLYVLAANYSHFLYYCRQQGLNPQTGQIKYLSSIDQLWGENYDDCKFFYYETWRAHPNSLELHRQIGLIKSIAKPSILEEQVMEPVNDNFWYRLTKLDPALYRGLIVATVAVLASVGVAVAPGIPDALIAFVVIVVPIIQALWTRPAVTANARVAVVVPDPVNEPDVVEPGEAVTTASNADILEAAKA